MHYFKENLFQYIGKDSGHIYTVVNPQSVWERGILVYILKKKIHFKKVNISGWQSKMIERKHNLM